MQPACQQVFIFTCCRQLPAVSAANSFVNTDEIASRSDGPHTKGP
jgi:hypothetical protein